MNTTLIQDSKYFWLLQGISMVWKLLAHTHWMHIRGTLRQHSSPGGFRTELHQVLECIFEFYFLKKIWGLVHNSCSGKSIACSKKVYSKTALFLQTANPYLGPYVDHIPKVAKAIFKQDTCGPIFIAQIDSVKSGFIEAAIVWGYVMQKLRADYPNYSFKYMGVWILL